MENNIDGSDINVGSIEEDIKIVEKLRKELGLYVNGTKIRQSMAIDNVLSKLKIYKNKEKFYSKVAKDNDEMATELETYKKIADTFKNHCKRHKVFCETIRDREKREPDEFNQGREYIADQFLNLINGKEDWELTDNIDWARKEVEKDE